MKTKSIIIFLLIILLSHVNIYAQDTGTLIIEIGSLKNNDGQVAISIHNGEEGYPGGEETMVQATYATIKDGKAIAEFIDLPFGEYAISAYHDEDKNGELNTNWIGIPKEGTGASNNAKGKMGPPKYEDAMFEFAVDGQKIKFEMVYL